VDETFLESVVHKRAPFLARQRGYSGHVVLGRRLRAFSFWHLELLQGNESKFLQTWKTRPPSIEIFKQLYLATEICRLRPLEPLHSSWRATLCRKWTVFCWYVWPRINRRHRRACIFLLIEAAKFRAYLADYWSRPIPFPTKHSRPIQSPPNLFEMELFRRFHPDNDERELWGMPPGLAAWENTAALEAHDREVSILTEARRKAREEAIKQGAMRSKRRSAGNGNGESSARR
jgi:hypothetical protein